MTMPSSLVRTGTDAAGPPRSGAQWRPVGSRAGPTHHTADRISGSVRRTCPGRRFCGRSCSGGGRRCWRKPEVSEEGRDPHAMLRSRTSAMPGRPLTTAARSLVARARTSVWRPFGELRRWRCASPAASPRAAPHDSRFGGGHHRAASRRVRCGRTGRLTLRRSRARPRPLPQPRPRARAWSGGACRPSGSAPAGRAAGTRGAGRARRACPALGARPPAGCDTGRRGDAGARPGHPDTGGPLRWQPRRRRPRGDQQRRGFGRQRGGWPGIGRGCR